MANNESKIIITAQDATKAAFDSVAGNLNSIKSAADLMKTALGALGVGLSAGFFVDLIKGTIDSADKMNDLSKSTGIAVEQLAGLKLAAKQSGGDLDSIAASINKLSVNMGKDADKFAALGISAKNPLEAFKQLSDIFVTLQDPQQRAAIAAAALGKSWAGAAPLLAEGSAKIQEMVDKGTSLSGMTKEMAHAADEFNDKMAELGTTLGSTRNKLVGELLPGMNDVAKAMQEAAREGGMLTTVWIALGGAYAMLVGKTDSQQLKTRLNEISDQLAVARKQLSAGTLNPAGANDSMFSFLVPNIKLGDTAIAQLKATIDRLEAEKARLAPTKTEAPGVDPGAAAAAAKKAADFLNAERSAADVDSAYRNLVKTLKDKLLVDKDITEVNKLQIALDALSAKQLESITPARRQELQDMAKRIDLNKLLKESIENTAKNEEALTKMREEGAAAAAKYANKIGEAVLATDKNIEQMKFETSLIGMSNSERDTAIALRTMEIAGIDRQSEAFTQLADRMRAAIGTKEVAQAAAEAHKQATDEITQFWKSAAHNIQSSMGNLFFDVLQGNLKNLSSSFKATMNRMVADVLAAKAATGLFGADFGKGGELGGLVGTGLKMLGIGGPSYVTGGAGAGTWTSGMDLPLGSYASGTDYVPRTGLYQLHQGEKVVTASQNAGDNGASVSMPITINAPGADAGAVARIEASMARFQREVVPQVVDAVRRGGSARRFMRS